MWFGLLGLDDLEGAAGLTRDFWAVFEAIIFLGAESRGFRPISACSLGRAVGGAEKS
jgi:hypothetical protein